MSVNTLSASYTSPENAPFSVNLHLPAPTSSPVTVEQRAAYLNVLRVHVTDAQARINKELTERMEEDKARDTSSKGDVVDDAKDEENYGEEVQEDED